MIDIAVLRTMVKHGATIDMVLAVIEADQIVRERKARERINSRMAKRGNGNNGHRTVQQAADDLLRATEQAAGAPRNWVREATHAVIPKREGG